MWWVKEFVVQRLIGIVLVIFPGLTTIIKLCFHGKSLLWTEITLSTMRSRVNHHFVWRVTSFSWSYQRMCYSSYFTLFNVVQTRQPYRLFRTHDLRIIEIIKAAVQTSCRSKIILIMPHIIFNDFLIMTNSVQGIKVKYNTISLCQVISSVKTR